MTYYLRTANQGWLTPPSPLAHLPWAIHIQADHALDTDEYRLYDEDKPIEETRRIGEKSVSEIRKALQRHEEAREREPEPVVQVTPVEAHHVKQATLWG